MVHFTQKEQHEAAAAALAACQHKQQLMQRQQYVPAPATAEPLFQPQPQPYFAYQQQQQPGAPAVFQFAPPGLTFAPPPTPTATATPAMMMMPTTAPLPQQPLQHPVAAAPHGHLVIPHQHQQNGLIVTNVNVLPERFKTKLCRNFMKDGKCQYEHRCMFAHGQDDLRTTEMNLNDGLITEEAIRSFQRASKTRDEEGSCSNSSTSGETDESSADLVSSQVLVSDQHLEVKNSPSSPVDEPTNQHA